MGSWVIRRNLSIFHGGMEFCIQNNLQIFKLKLVFLYTEGKCWSNHSIRMEFRIQNKLQQFNANWHSYQANVDRMGVFVKNYFWQFKWENGILISNVSSNSELPSAIQIRNWHSYILKTCVRRIQILQNSRITLHMNK